MGQYDILLRHIAHRQATAFAQALVPEVPVRTARWLDTQLTMVRERRADKALELDTSAGPALLKVELAVDPRGSIFFRMFQYSALALIAQHAARSGATVRPTHRRRPAPPRTVYQRTVDELMARPGSFWLVYTCLAVDANVEKMRLVIDEIRRREPCEEDRDELHLALLTLAELDPWGTICRRRSRRCC